MLLPSTEINVINRFILKTFSYDHGCSKSSCDADVRLGINTDFPKTDRKTKTKCIFSLQVMIAGVFLGEGEEKMIGVKTYLNFYMYKPDVSLILVILLIIYFKKKNIVSFYFYIFSFHFGKIFRNVLLSFFIRFPFCFKSYYLGLIYFYISFCTHLLIYIGANKYLKCCRFFQVFPLTKNGEICNFHRRYTSTVRNRIKKKIQKITLYDFYIITFHFIA